MTSNIKNKIPKLFKEYKLQVVDLYHKYKADAEKLNRTKYRIHSSLTYYQTTGLIQLSFNDKPGDLLPPMHIVEIKNNQDILSGLHPIDVNSINDLYYLSQDKISNLTVDEDKITVTNQSGQRFEYDLKSDFNHQNLLSKRVSFLIGYIQAEKLMREAYSVSLEKYKILQDRITTLYVLNNETNEESIKNPMDILFSNDYKYYSKEDIARIGFICGQMSNISIK